MIFHPRDLFYRFRGRLLQSKGIWLGRRRTPESYSAALGDYLQDTLLSRLEIPSARVLPIGDSADPIVCRLMGPATSWLIHCFPRPAGSGPCANPSAHHRSRASLMAQHHISVPAHCMQDAGDLILGRYGFEIILERWPEGRTLVPEDFRNPKSRLLSPLATLLARLHGIRSPALSIEPATLLLREMAALKRIEGTSVVRACDDLPTIRRRLDGTRQGLNAPPPYPLVHGDLRPEILILGPQGDITPVDFSTAHYGYWPQDIVSFHENMADQDIDVTHNLLSEYRRARPELDPAHLRDAWPYLHLWHHFGRIVKAIDRVESSTATHNEAAREYYTQNARAHLAQVRQILSAPNPFR